MSLPTAPYYRADLALVHDRGFSFHADACAPAVVGLLAEVRERSGVVLELGCGSGHLTRHLVAAGHRVIATDASPAMLDLTRARVPDVYDVRRLTLPDDPLPTVDAVVSVGHAVSYLADEAQVHRALAAAGAALNPGGVLALDMCDLRYGIVRSGNASSGQARDDWAIVAEFSTPAPDRFVRQMAVFVRDVDGRWHRDDERHDNVLVDTSVVPALLAEHGVTARVATSLGDYMLPEGLVAVVGSKAAPAPSGG